MRHNLNGRVSLEDDIRLQVEKHVRRYLESVRTSSTSNISRLGILDYIQDCDKTLARKKKSQLEKIIDSICTILESESLIQDQVPHGPQNNHDTEMSGHNTAGQSTISSSAIAVLPEQCVKRKDNVNERLDPKTKRLKTHDRNIVQPGSSLCLADVGGLDKCIAEVLETIVLPLTHPEVYIHTGVPTPRGVLLHGPPGCGKTLLAHAIAGEVGLPFISISAPSIVSGMSGESEKKVRDIFEEAKQVAPCLLFIDEIDAVTPKRESAQREMERRIVAQFLTCMDDLSLENTNGKPVLIIGATNRPDSLDSALRRAGRFDREICMGVPDERGRELILAVLCRKLRISGDLQMNKLARMTPGFVGADLNALTSAAGVVAIKRIFSTMHQNSLPLLKDDEVTQIDSTDGNFENQNSLPCETNVSAIRKFLENNREPLSPAALEPLSIEYDDFLAALPTVQPSSKREGFTTVPDVSWNDIGALSAIRVELQMAIVQPIRRPQLYKSVGITAPVGVLLWGPPGCGKTLLAKAVANESKANFISVRGPELLNKYVGESERAVRQVFVRARASAPCVIFFDELDALVPRRDDSLSESSARIVNTLLTELDGLNDRQGVFVVAATNRPDIIDPAMLRPGRLDKSLFVQLPTSTERIDILRTLTERLFIDPSIDLTKIAQHEQCNNFSGADLAALVREAAISALRTTVLHNSYETETEDDATQPRIVITHSDFNKTFEKVRPSVSESQRLKYDKLLSRYSS